MIKIILSLSNKILLAFIAVLLPIIIVFFISYRNIKEDQEELVLENLRGVADDSEEDLLSFIYAHRERVEELASNAFLNREGIKAALGRGADLNALSTALKEKLTTMDKFYRFTIYSLEGRVAASTINSNIGLDRSNEAFFKNALSGKMVSERRFGYTGFPELAVSSLIRDQDTGEARALLTGFIMLTELSKVFTGEIRRLGVHQIETRDIYLVNRDKYFISEPHFLKGAIFSLKADTLPVKECLGTGDEMMGFYRDYRGEQVAGASMCLSAYGWVLIAEDDRNEALRTVFEIERYSLATFGITAGFIGLLVLYFSRSIISPIKVLSEGASEIASGNYEVNLPVRSGDEIGLLSDAFNRMAKGIKEREEALKQSETSLAEAQRLAHIGNWEWDIDRNLSIWSNEIDRIFGVKKDQIKPTYEGFLDYVHPDDKPLVKKAVEDSLYRGKKYSLDFRIVRPDGAIKSVRAQGEVTYGEYGRPIKMFGTMQDITERKLAEKQLEESEKKYRNLVENAPVGVYRSNLKGEYLYVNEGVRRICECATTEECIKAGAIANFKDPGERTKLIELIKKNKKIEGFEVEIITRTGKIKNVIVNAILEDDTLTGMYLDITERKQAEKALTESERKYRTLIESLQEGVWVLDKDGYTAYTNPKMAEILGYTEKEMLGRHLFSFMEEHLIEQIKKRLEKRRAGITESYDIEFIRKDGEKISVSINSTPLFDENKNYTGGLAGVVDITERKRIEEEVRKLNAELEKKVEERTAELEAANRELESFSYSVAHDLRAPLRMINGFTRSLMKSCAEKLPAEEREKFEHLVKAGARMGLLIEDLLSISRITGAEMKTEQVAISSLAASVAAELKKSEPQRKVETAIQEGLRAKGDPVLLRAVLENLIRNSWKFTRRTPEPKIEFGEAGTDDGRIIFYVRDNGVGFDMKYADRLFRPFQRLHSEEEFPGTGIGLATVQRIIQKHGGRVWTEARVGKGATFYFTLNKAE